jgi:hypothetical protein
MQDNTVQKGIYADDYIIDKVKKHKMYIVATNNQALKLQVKKFSGVPISVASGKVVIEMLPDALGKYSGRKKLHSIVQSVGVHGYGISGPEALVHIPGAYRTVNITALVSLEEATLVGYK